MAPYDSDSDDGDDAASYTETNVLLGYAAEEPSDDTISYLGGTPSWINDETLPSATLAKCKVCNDFMVLLLQLNADLPEQFPGHERRLYIFTCRRKTCRRKEGSVRVLRSSRTFAAPKKVVPKKEEVEEKPKVNIGETLFGSKGSSSGNANPFSMGGAGGKENPFSTGVKAGGSSHNSSNPFAKPTPSEPPEAKDLPQTFAEKLNINNPQQTHGPPPPSVPWPEQSSFPTPYPKLYLVDADYEILDRTPEIAQNITVGTMDIESEGASGGKEDKEVFESEIDKTFQKFADRIGCNPEQVLRYEFVGAPLLYSKKDAVGKMFSEGKGKGGGMPRCGNCGRERVFECQLMPHAIMELERDEMGVDGMEWGTVVVGVCKGDCVQNFVKEGEVGWMEEWVGVQWEDVGR
ncbi:hypothetical protein GLAREA_02914 [Glarea lozoyensis ATCC 20868]|uniref:Programmed cell death protein 2 C-terminal domain-containing protein n=1 Tax=Glarea lozoyensis (strain ATCC 20868 / MF5171) TaxID=1116229 RepID=S3CMP2_GLAL2|nr:uncharacterized protein GLAREA_02914 [Glarea lozoyensis ATCC 20868]EPE27000.1 hypothetical protein GLAREA_02914 [Glarea lozoyensis ATCC 20868]